MGLFFRKKRIEMLMLITVLSLIIVYIFVDKEVDAQVMSGSQYQLEIDSINFGGNKSDSSTYNLIDTIGEVGSGESTGNTYSLNAGFLQADSVYQINIVPPDDVVMSPSIPGITGGYSDGSTSFEISTDNPAGYSVTIKSTDSPSLKNDLDSFADYSPSGGEPDYNFSVPALQSTFGFSPEGADLTSRYKDNGSSCNTGSLDTADKCWDGLDTTDKTISLSNSSNYPSYTETTIKFKAGVSSGRSQVAGIYVATTTITILPN